MTDNRMLQACVFGPLHDDNQPGDRYGLVIYPVNAQGKVLPGRVTVSLSPNGETMAFSSGRGGVESGNGVFVNNPSIGQIIEMVREIGMSDDIIPVPESLRKGSNP